jgi:hypothetical protein
LVWKVLRHFRSTQLAFCQSEMKPQHKISPFITTYKRPSMMKTSTPFCHELTCLLHAPARAHKSRSRGSTGWLNFARWRLVSVGSKYGTCFMSPFWCLEFYSGSNIIGKRVYPWFKLHFSKTNTTPLSNTISARNVTKSKTTPSQPSPIKTWKTLHSS